MPLSHAERGESWLERKGVGESSASGRTK